jgi:pyruvate dehydrogenase E1 component alpha subunit
MAEMMGKRTGVSGGKGGSMHLASRAHNFWGGYAIVGGHFPLAVGIAMEPRYNGKDQVIICFCGDGATNNGYFHEAMNLSQVWDLPVVWIIENNFVGMGTRIEDASGQTELHKRAVAYNMKDMGRVDGQDVFAMHKVATEAVAYAREKGPVLIEALTYRYKGHGVSDKSYDTRFGEELAEYKEHKDPITILKRHLVEKYKNIEPELAEIEAWAHAQTAEAVAFAESSPDPDYNDLVRHVYVEQ